MMPLGDPAGSALKIGESSKPAFGFTRYGKYNSPKAVIIGRGESKRRLQGTSPGFTFYEAGRVGRDKPHALILSRPKYHFEGIDPDFQDIFGWTRFGKAGTPSAVLRSRPQVKVVSEPGPGAYDLEGCDACRIGISLKGRWPEADWDGYDIPGPKYALPGFIGKGPAFSLSPKYPDQSVTNSSPGPIYLLPLDKKTPKSLTFKPFPLTSDDSGNGPAKYNITEPAKKTFRAPPAAKFAKGYCGDCDWTPKMGSTVGPGPGAFNIRDCSAIGPNPPTAVIASRPKFKFTSSGSGKFVDLFGMTRFGPAGRKAAILRGKHFPKEKSADTGPLVVPEGPERDGTFKCKKIGIAIKSRLKGLELNSAEIPGPGAYNLAGFMGKGPAYSLAPKHRGPLGPSENANTIIHTDVSECLPSTQKPGPCFKSQSEKPKTKRQILPPKSNNVFDVIPYLEQLCTNY